MVSARTLLSYGQRWALLDAQGGRLIALCFDAGVFSTAMMLALKAADLRPQVITFASMPGVKQHLSFAFLSKALFLP